jgi:hypothetical protein
VLSVVPEIALRDGSKAKASLLAVFATVVTDGGEELVTDGDGDLVTDGDGELVTDGDGELVIDGDGDLVTDGDGELVTDGDGEWATPTRFVVDDLVAFVEAMFVAKVEEFVVPTQPTRISASAEAPNRRSSVFLISFNIILNISSIY